MRVFFYGLFMDADLLAARGIKPVELGTGFVDGFQLRIGERATLVPGPGNRAYGVLIDIAADELNTLYAESSVADYRPETLTVELWNGSRIEATCYILPVEKVTGTNRAYARSLLDIATRLDFPDSYLDEIKRSAS